MLSTMSVHGSTFGHRAMSELSPLWKEERKLDFGTDRAALSQPGCQSMSGAPLRAVVMTRPGTFVLLSGEPTEYLKTADSGAVRPQEFCSRCGTTIYSTSVGDDPKVYNVRVGALRQRNELVPRRQLFVRSQLSWINDLTSIQKFDKMPTP